MPELLHRELTQDIIGAAMKVLNALKPGHDEKVYENALVIELRRRGHTVEQQKEFPIFYEGHRVGTGRTDLIVDSKVIVDPKVIVAFNETNWAQMTGYLAITRSGSGPSPQFQIRPPWLEARPAFPGNTLNQHFRGLPKQTGTADHTESAG